MNIAIRKPLRSEIPKLAELGARLFAETFAGLYSEQDLQAFLDQVHSPAGVEYDWNAGCEFWIAESAGQGGASESWVGYCKAGPIKVPLELKGRRGLELRQIYIDRDYHRLGIGAEFMAHFLEYCRLREVDLACVSCWTDNAQALAFYHRFGFEIVGTYDFFIGAHCDQDHILCKRLNRGG